MPPDDAHGRRDYDVVVVGGGVVGCAIAWRLSFTTARVALVEAAHDVGEGASKGNTGIATSGAEARALEPLISPRARAAVHIPDDGIVDSLRLTIGYAELAARNGVDVLTGAPVAGFDRDGGRIAAVRTARGRLAARFVVNAAGIEAGRISGLAGGDEFEMWPRQGQYLLLDRELGGRFAKIVGGVPTEVTRGIYCVPTTNGSLLLGPTAVDARYPGEKAVDADTLDAVFAAAQRLVPAVRRDQAIKLFAANRPASDPVYRVGPDSRVGNLVHAAGIRSTGVSSSPATADLVHALLADAGAPVEVDDASAQAALPPLPRLLGHPDPERLLDLDPRYGQVVCACEQVTAAEIAAACAMRVPPRSLDALRKRTRAAGGRCQGTVCLAGVSFLLSLHMGMQPWEIPVGEPEATLGVAP